MPSSFPDLGILYGICDLGYLSKERALPVSEELLRGGVKVLQLRAKGHAPETLLDLSLALRELCQNHGATFIVNDHLQLARDSQAHGIHLGQDDGSLAEARSFLGPDLVYGRSTHSPEQAHAALTEGFDYIGFGPLFPTPTKAGRPGIGLENIRTVEESVGGKIPVFCIGGLKPANFDEVKAAGARRVVVVSHLLTAPEPGTEARHIISHFSPTT